MLDNANQMKMEAMDGLKQVLNGDAPNFLEESFEDSPSKQDSERRGQGAKESFRYI